MKWSGQHVGERIATVYGETANGLPRAELSGREAAPTSRNGVKLKKQINVRGFADKALETKV